MTNKVTETNLNGEVTTILDVSQTVLGETFTMMMVCEVDSKIFTDFVSLMEQEGKKQGLVIHVMHEDIFNAMHKI